MAINLSNQYSDTLPPNADYPFGRAKNVTSPTATDGTPWEKAYIDNLEGFLQGVLAAANATPTGNADTVRAPQLLSALINTRWYEFIDYQVGTKTIGSDGVEYTCKQANGPATTARNPTTAGNRPQYWQESAIDILEKNNPIGTVREFAVSTNPATLLGFGTWAADGPGRTVVGADGIPSSPFENAGTFGGSLDHSHAAGTLTAAGHTHEVGDLVVGDHTLTTAEMPQHNHGRGIILIGASGKIEGYAGPAPGNDNYDIQTTANEGGGQAHDHPITGRTDSNGASVGGNTAAAANLPPYIVRNRWRRTA